MPKFRTKSIIVEAIQFTGSNFYECSRFVGTGDLTGNDMLHPTDNPVVPTAHGSQAVAVRDWIVRDPTGSFSICTPEEFEACFDRMVQIHCPDCGEVDIKGGVFEGGRAISGECPKCGDRLYFG